MGFHDEEGGSTRLVLTRSPLPEQTAGGVREGWESSFTKLLA